MGEISVPCCLQLDNEVTSTTIHAFTDALGDAYAAAIYARQQYEDVSINVCLVLSKSRIAPLSAKSIFRLQLMVPVLRLRLAFSVANVLKIDQKSLIVWTDSMNVLFWIRKPIRGFKPLHCQQGRRDTEFNKYTKWRHASL